MRAENRDSNPAILTEFIDGHTAKRTVPCSKRTITIVTIHRDQEDKAIAGRAFLTGSLLILILPFEESVANACRQLLVSAAEADCLSLLFDRDDRQVASWTVSYQELFDNRFEVAPFANAIDPNTPFNIRVVIQEEPRFRDAPYLIRDRMTSCLTAWIREGCEDSDIAAIRELLRGAWEMQNITREYFRNEAAQWLTTEEMWGNMTRKDVQSLLERWGRAC